MNQEEVIKRIEYVRDNPNVEGVYYDLLRELGNVGHEYWNYMHNEENELINIDSELLYLENGDFTFLCALLTAILREDHFCNGVIRERYKKGQITSALNRMIKTFDVK